MVLPRSWHAACVLCISTLAIAPAWGQSHEVTSGAYTLRASTVASNMLAPGTAREHGIERAPTRGVLNVTLMKDRQTVAAEVEVSARSLTGKSRPVTLAPTTVNGYVSYTGAYDFVHGEVLDFTIQATPQGAGEPLILTFRERMWGRGDLPDERQVQ
ncbi:DUF4426 domain-containing protein [Massilia sp. UMI-21]|nr:DUF4426 domain-containing protein [Massilia sp. UMI-21]